MMRWWQGKPWNRDTLEQVLDRLNSELALPENVPGGMPHFRTTAVASFFFKFFINTSLALNKDIQVRVVTPACACGGCLWPWFAQRSL